MGLWIYRATDQDGCILSESYSRGLLIEKLMDEFGSASSFRNSITGELETITIKRIYEKNLK